MTYKFTYIFIITLKFTLSLSRFNNMKEPEYFEYEFSDEEVNVFGGVFYSILEKTTKKYVEDKECYKEVCRFKVPSSDISVITLGDPYDLSRLNFLYGRPTDWTRCTRSCKTHRLWHCIYFPLCKTSTVKENALCCAPRSKCNSKVKRKIQKFLKATEEKVKEFYSSNEYTETHENYHGTNNALNYDYYDFVNVNDYDSINYESENYDSHDHTNDINVDKSYNYGIGDENYDFDFDSDIDSDPVNYIDYLVYQNYDENQDDYSSSDDEYDYSYYGEHVFNSRKKKDKNDRNNKETSPSSEDETIEPLECGIRQEDTNKGVGPSLRIVKGSEVLKGSWPWQVAILDHFKELHCGGTLLNPYWVLTAAHCVKHKNWAVFGEHNIWIDENEITFKVQKSFVHPEFSLETFESDIALLKLPRGVGGYAPACLPGLQMNVGTMVQTNTTQILSEDKNPTTNTNKLMRNTKRRQKGKNRRTRVNSKKHCVILGWGKERNTHVFGSTVLNYAKIPITSKKFCKRAYPEFVISKNMICAGHKKGGADSCYGDSGGPLLCPSPSGRWEVRGVTSFGDGCGGRKPGVYTKVVNYLKWIQDIINNN